MDTTTLWLVILILAAAAVYVVAVHNGLASLRNRARSAWSDIDVQLKRRHDLVPNLVAAVQGYASHEKSVFEDAARLRARAIELQDVKQLAGTENELAGTIKSIFAIAESYPELKADSSFRDLQTQLTEVEDTIQYARRYYNAVVRDLNTRCETFPSGIIAGWFGFSRLEYFRTADEDRDPVQVRLEES